MFDANLRHLPKGYTFFAKAWGISGNTKLESLGIKDDEVFICRMLSKGSKNPSILIRGTQLTSNEVFYDVTVIYAGSLNGTGFYTNFPSDKEAALALLGGT